MFKYNTQASQEWLEENLTRELNDLSHKEHRHFFATLNRAYMSVSRSLDLFRSLLDKNVENVLGVRLSSPTWDLDVPEPTHPDVAFTKIFDFHFDLLWFVIPMLIFRSAFEKHFLKQVPGIVQIHLSRLAYQWEQRINKTIEKIRDQALKYVQEELSTIDTLLSHSSGRSEEIHKAIQHIREDIQNLQKLKA